tara:strand:- start:6122 stop:7252 length:1131 start_codon:yes stop_codon:yes gene_type:complete
MDSRALADINGTPTQGMVSEATKGLEWRSEFGRGGTEVGIARARDIKNKKNLSVSTIKRMFSFFSRHEVDKKAEGFRPGEEGYPSNGRIAWALWGGDAGFSWSKRKVKEIKNEEERTMESEQRHIKKIEETEDEIIITYEKEYDENEVETPLEETPMEEDMISEDYRNDLPKKETRTFTLDNLEVREEDGQSIVVGYGSVFNSLSNNLGGFRELISPRAFEGRLEDDVRFLFNHDANYIMGRTISGTLKLRTDEKGLRYEVRLPDTQVGRDLRVSLERGDVTQSSFAFTVEDDSWERTDQGTIRTIEKVSRLYDVSAVTYPAYEDATVGLRSMETWKKSCLDESLRKEKEDNKREEKDLHKRSLAALKLKLNKLNF